MVSRARGVGCGCGGGVRTDDEQQDALEGAQAAEACAHGALAAGAALVVRLWVACEGEAHVPAGARARGVRGLAGEQGVVGGCAEQGLGRVGVEGRGCGGVEGCGGEGGGVAGVRVEAGEGAVVGGEGGEEGVVEV